LCSFAIHAVDIAVAFVDDVVVDVERSTVVGEATVGVN
jgi:hypothetical protein